MAASAAVARVVGAAADPYWQKREEVKQHAETKGAVWLYWELMVMESAKCGGNGVDVNREGYRSFHLRVSKSLEASFNMSKAEAVANKDWAEDITAFSGDSADLIWLEEVKKKIRDVTRDIVKEHGWKALFARYDTDGSGDIDFDEFCTAARTDCHIRPEDLSDSELKQLFSDANADGSVGLSCAAFCGWIIRLQDGGNASPTFGQLHEIKEKFRTATEVVVKKIGWSAVFASYDTDGSGELDKDEFINLVRKDCDLDENVLADAAPQTQDMEEGTFESEERSDKDNFL